MEQNKQAEWKRILIEILRNEIKVSPWHMTTVMGIQQYQRALNSLRKIFGKPNIDCVDDGLTSLGKKKTFYRVIRNEYTEKKLRELQGEGKIDKNIWFNYPRSEGGFPPPTFAPSEKPPDFPSNAHRIAHENSLKLLKNQDQLTLI